jgi:phytoene dehydrogenase-like protein
MLDAIVIGAGPNGLVAASYLAAAGRRVQVVERGGGGGDVRPDAGWVPAPVVADLALERFGWKHPGTDPWLTVPLSAGGTLELRRDVAATAEGIRRLSAGDAARWPEFCARMARLSRFLERVYLRPPANPLGASGRDLLGLAQLARRARGLGREGLSDLLRFFPMSVGELLDDWFESDALKGALGAIGVRNLCQGPRGGGTSFVLLHHHVGSPPGVFDAGSGEVRGALVRVARDRGVEVRHGAEVVRILTRGGRAYGVGLAGGQEVEAPVVLSSVDPRRTFLHLVDPDLLPPEFRHAAANLKFRGVRALLSLTLADRPPFDFVSVAPSLEYVERAYDDAKYGRISGRPAVEARYLGRGNDGRHLVTVYAQYAPYRLTAGEWSHPDRQRLVQAVVEALTGHVKELAGAVLDHAVLAPPDLEAAFGLTEGHLYQGELTLDQILFMRPIPGWAGYRTPVPGLYLCGAGAHPGGGIIGAAAYNAARVVLREAL